MLNSRKPVSKVHSNLSAKPITKAKIFQQMCEFSVSSWSCSRRGWN